MPLNYQPDSQSNHECYFIPDDLIDLKGKPLYVLIAHWGFRRNEPFFRDDVAKAFGLTERRAASMMGYLHRKTSLAKSTLETVQCGPRKNNCKLSMRIVEIYNVGDFFLDDDALKKNVEYKARGRTKKRRDTPQSVSLWSQLLTRPLGAKVILE